MRHSVADQGCLSRIRILSIPDQHFFHPGSEPASKNLSTLSQKLFLSSWKYDHFGSGTQIRILIFYPFRIPDLGVKKASDPEFGTATLVRQDFFDPGLVPEPNSLKSTTLPVGSHLWAAFWFTQLWRPLCSGSPSPPSRPDWTAPPTTGSRRFSNPWTAGWTDFS